jgi:hypothetical protein
MKDMLTFDVATDNPEYQYEPKLRRYRSKTSGKFLRKEAIAQLTEGHIQNVKNDLKTVSQLLINGKISLRNWQTTTAETLKILHTQEYLLGIGGQGAIKKENYLEIGRELKVQYQYLRNFAVELTQGKMTPAEVLNRATMYGDAAKVSYFRGERTAAKNAGLTYGMRILGIAEHCPECLIYHARGIVPIDELILPTQACSCMFKCKCTAKYLKTDELPISEAS